VNIGFLKTGFFCGLLAASPLLRAADDAVSRAMRDEMQRSMQKLKLEQFDKPYFISYLIADNEQKEVAATLGSILSSAENVTRVLLVTVRVGDYTVDSGNFVSVPTTPEGMANLVMAGAIQLPLDDNYNELRRKIWLTTDRAYKRALEDFSSKQAVLKNKNRSESIADFSKMAPVSVTDLAPRADLDLPKATQLVRAISAAFRQSPSIQTSRAQIAMFNRQERYLNSEGTWITRRQPRIALRVTASAQAPDGLQLSDYIAAYGYSLKDLPSETALTTQVRELQTEFEKLQAAPLQGRYEGPVLFEGQAAAEVFARHFAGGLTAVPPAVWGNDQLAQGFRSQPNGMLDQVGTRVLPSFIDVADDPTATHEKEQLLFGGYKVDLEGIVPRRTLLIEHGILKTVLTTRAPVRGISASTGNLRELGVAPSNLFVSSSKASTTDELRRRLLDSAKEQGNPYGLIVRRLSGKAAVLTYRIYPDGHEELVRNADVADVTPASFKNISAVSDQRTVYTEAAPVKTASPFSINAAAGGQPLVSYIVPSVLFNDVTIEKPSGESPKPTVLSNPVAEKR
jgi:predicted Zn-dependent protease